MESIVDIWSRDMFPDAKLLSMVGPMPPPVPPPPPIWLVGVGDETECIKGYRCIERNESGMQ